MNLKGRLAAQAIVVLGFLGTATSASAQSWTTQPAMKVARVEATTVDYRDDIYVFNGFSPGIVIANSVEKYNVATKQWNIISTTSTNDGSAVTHNGVVRTGADVWIIGGRIGSHPGRVSDKVWVFNLDSGNWRRGPDLPVPVAAGGAALVNNKIHWIGGIDPNARCDVARHLTYDLGSPSAGWKDITSTAGMPSPRNHFSTAVVDGIIYVMGGQYGHDGCPGKFTQDTPLVHAYNPANNNWSRKADMPSKNSHSEPGTFVYKNEIYTTGGEGAGNKVWKYNPRANNWSTYKTLPESLVAPIARIIDGHLIVAGGGAPTAAKATNRVRSLLVDNNPPTPTPTPTPQQPEPGSGAPEGATLISMEAEYFDISSKTSTHQWVHVARGNSSNDDAMTTTPDQGELAGSTENTPMLSYLVYFNHPGKHYIWIRGSGDTNNESGIGNSDSVHVGLNGDVARTAYRIDQFPAEWSWSRHTPSDPVASLNVVNAGVNVVNFWMREDGLAIDKFVISSSPNFVPTGYGPDVTDGTDDYVPPASSEANEEDTNTANENSEESAIDEPAEDDTAADNSAETAVDESADSEETNNYPVETEHSNDNPVDADTTNEELIGTDQTNDESVESDPTNSDNTHPPQTDTTTVDAVDTDTDADTESSRKGLFGASSSFFTLLALFSLCLLRVDRRLLA